MAIRYTFKAYERLKREQHIDTLFRTGKAFSISPVRFIYLAVPRSAGSSPVQAGFSVPKKKFRKSVDRHRIRRLMVESWRLNKHILYAALPTDKQLHLFLIYTGIEMPEIGPIQQSVISAIEKLSKQFAAPANA
ncbi:MAG: ribonuclease P protein component [Sphingobacteriales bacterium]|nr:MAG: ribonuclease P protein component [Sphingobacteriales bacterium]